MEQKTVVGAELEIVTTHSPEERVRRVIERIRPYIQSHGGDVHVVGVERSTVTLKIDGTCTHCPLANQTYNKMVKTLLGKEVPEIKNVVLA